MLLRKREVLKYLPNVKTLSKEAVKKAKEGERLTTEASKAREISEALKGVTLFNDFPLIVRRFHNEYDIQSGCDEVKRSAYVKLAPNSTKFTVTTYATTTHTDGATMDGEFKKAEALQMAKEFVATGRKVKVTNRGRVGSR